MPDCVHNFGLPLPQPRSWDDCDEDYKSGLKSTKPSSRSRERSNVIIAMFFAKPFVNYSDDCDDVSEMRISNPLLRSSNNTFCLNIRAVICRLILFVNREAAILSRDTLRNHTKPNSMNKTSRANCAAQVCWSLKLLSVHHHQCITIATSIS